MLEAESLSKSYGDFEAVQELSFSIPEGEVVGLLGPNGAGKTTTMRMLTTFIPPSSGSARVAGFDIAKQSAEVRKNIGYLPETPALYPEMRVTEFLRFVGKIKGIPSKVLSSRIEEMLERCILSEVKNKLCANLSRGFRQRVGLASAIIHKPKVIILDEPTSGLDPAQIIEIRKLIRSLGDDHTVILSTHILPEVAETCTQAIIIARGRLVVRGTLEELTKERGLEERFLEAVAGEYRAQLAEGESDAK